MRVIVAVTNGIGVMPAYQGELSSKEIEAVAHYVSVSAEKLDKNFIANSLSNTLQYLLFYISKHF